MKKIVYILALLLLATSAFAVGNNTAADLDARYAHFLCGVTLQQAQATELNKYLQAPSTDVLSSDLATIKAAADSGDTATFLSATKALQNDVKTINSEMKTARQSFRTLNESHAEKRTEFSDLASTWKDNLDTYKTCVLSAQQKVATLRASQIQSDIDNWNKVIADMNSKGFDTSQLQTIVTSATTLVTSLNDAAQADNETTYAQDINSIRDQYLHLWARFAITRINLYLAKITSAANAAGMGDKVSTISTLLNSASALATPGTKYGEGDFTTTWQDIKDAATQLSNLSKALQTTNDSTGGNK